MKITFTEEGKKAVVDQKLEIGMNFLGYIPTINGTEVYKDINVKQNSYDLVMEYEPSEIKKESLYPLSYMPTHNYTENEEDEGVTYTSWNKGVLKLKLDNNTFPNIEIDLGITIEKITIYGYRWDDTQYVKNKSQDSLDFYDTTKIVPFFDVEFEAEDDTKIYNEVINGCVREIVINLSLSDKDNENLVTTEIPNKLRSFELVDDGLGTDKGLVIKDNSINVEEIPGLGEFDHIQGREGVIATISKVVVAEDIKTNNITYGFQSPARLHINTAKRNDNFNRQMMLSQSYTDEKKIYTYWDGVALSYRNDDVSVDNKGLFEIEPVGIDSCSVVVNSRSNSIDTNSFIVNSNNNNGSEIIALKSNKNNTNNGTFIGSYNNTHWNVNNTNHFINSNSTWSLDGDNGPSLFSDNTLIDTFLLENYSTTYSNTFVHVKGLYDGEEKVTKIYGTFDDNVTLGGKANVFKKIQSSILMGYSEAYLKNLENTIVIGTNTTDYRGIDNLALKGLNHSVVIGEMNTKILEDTDEKKHDNNVYAFGGKLSLETWNPERDGTRSTYLSFFGGLNSEKERDVDYSTGLTDSNSGEVRKLKKIYSIFGTGEALDDSSVSRRNGFRLVSVNLGIPNETKYAALTHGIELFSLNSEDTDKVVRSVILTSEGVILNDILNKKQKYKSWDALLS